MSIAEQTGQFDVAPLQVTAGQLITARSYLIDRMVPACERIMLPEKTLSGGQIRYRLVTGFGPAPLSGRRPWRLPRPPVVLQGEVGIDLRINSPKNWAHFLNIHLPLVFALCRATGLLPRDPTLVLPADAPGYILAMARLLDLRVQLTDAAVHGAGIAFDLDNWNILRPDRRNWVKQSGLLPHLAARIAALPPGPDRVFLARRDTRCLSNQTEVEAVLRPEGFTTVYPEDLDAAGQFALFHHARQIVAVHGAGLAPLLYRQPDARLHHLIEILPCGHMTDVYRVMAQQAGCGWTGVRGRIKPHYVRPAYRLGRGFTRFSLDAFEVDPVSVQLALQDFPAR